MQSQPALTAARSGKEGVESPASASAAVAEPLQIACIGRTFELGTLYNCHKDSVIPGLGLWKRSSLEQLVHRSNQPHSNTKLTTEDSMKAKANTLNVAAELKLSLLAGLIKVGGAGKYLNDKKTSSRQTRVTVRYYCTSRQERLVMEHLTELDFKEEILEMNSDATHFVTAILYGANAVMVFDSNDASTEEKQEITGRLEAVMKKFVEISGKVDVEMSDKDKSMVNSLTCTFYGDIRLENNPTSYAEALKVWRELPKLLLDEEQHVPITVWLYPINRLYNRNTKICLTISTALIDRVVEQIDRADSCAAAANDLLKCSTFCIFKGPARKAEEFLNALSMFTSLVKQQLVLLLPSIRSGNQSEQKLFDLMHMWDASPFALSRLENWLSDYQALDVMITHYLSKFREEDNIKEAVQAGFLQAAMLNSEWVIVYFFHLNSEDKHLSAMAEHVKKQDLTDKQTLSTEAGDLLPMHEIASRTMVKPTLRFVDFAKCNSKNDEMEFLFAEEFGECSEAHCSIRIYSEGAEVEKNYLPPSDPVNPNIELEEGKLIVDWEPPKQGPKNVDHYRVLFSDDDWKTRTQASATVCSVELPRQSKKTVYRVKIEAWGKYGKTACSDERTFEDPGTGGDNERQSQKEKAKLDSRLLTDERPFVRLLEMKEEHTDHSRQLRRLSYGPQSTKPMKTLLVVGATGAGKSTLANGFANHLLGVEFEDDYRFRIVNEDPHADQIVRQTEWVTAYVFYHQDTFPEQLPYSFTIVDTPGFGDTCGIEADEKIKRQLSHFFHSTEFAGIDSLDAIGFVVPSHIGRMTTIKRYLFHAVLALFGKDIEDNIFILATFADGQKPPVITAVDEDNIPYADYFKFNNSALFADEDSEDGDLFNKFSWKMAASGYDKFLTHISQAETKSLTLTNEVLDERDRVQGAVSDLQMKIKIVCNESENLQAALDCFLNYQSDIDRNKDYTFTCRSFKTVIIHLEEGLSVTNCLICNTVCHYPCMMGPTDPLWSCSAMNGNGLNSTCCRCVGGCDWRQHHNVPYRFETVEETVTKTATDIKDAYERARQKQLSTGDLVLRIIKAIDEAVTEIINLVEEVRKSSNRLSDIALCPDYNMTDVEYIDVLINSEKEQTLHGWQQRVMQLTVARERTELITHANFDEFRALKKKMGEIRNGSAAASLNVDEISQWIKAWKGECTKLHKKFIPLRDMNELGV